MSEKRDITIDSKFGKQVVKFEVKKKKTTSLFRKTEHAQQQSQVDTEKRHEAIKRAESREGNEPQDHSSAQIVDMNTQKKREAFFGSNKPAYQKPIDRSAGRTEGPREGYRGERNLDRPDNLQYQNNTFSRPKTTQRMPGSTMESPKESSGEKGPDRPAKPFQRFEENSERAGKSRLFKPKIPLKEPVKQVPSTYLSDYERKLQALQSSETQVQPESTSSQAGRMFNINPSRFTSYQPSPRPRSVEGRPHRPEHFERRFSPGTGQGMEGRPRPFRPEGGQAYTPRTGYVPRSDRPADGSGAPRGPFIRRPYSRPEGGYVRPEGGYVRPEGGFFRPPGTGFPRPPGTGFPFRPRPGQEGGAAGGPRPPFNRGPRPGNRPDFSRPLGFRPDAARFGAPRGPGLGGRSFGAGPILAPRSTGLRKGLKRPTSTRPGFQQNAHRNTRFRPYGNMVPSQIGHQLLGKIESADDVIIDNERLRSIAAVRRSREKQRRAGIEREKVIHDVTVYNNLPITTLAHSIGVAVDQVIYKLKELAIPADRNTKLDVETAILLVEEFGHRYKRRLELLDQIKTDVGVEADYTPRAPIVTVVGHVDHGKTSLLDALRATQFTAGEAGGITQGIGASQVYTKDGRFVTFIDTPGHSVFTEMRARGINVTDIVLLIIAADDGIKEQTVESIQHAQAANASMIVVITKVDKPNVNLDKIKQMLTIHGVIVEELGGEVPFIDVSAKTGYHLQELLEVILLQGEMLGLKATSKAKSSGLVLEASLDKYKGPVATVIIRNGTLNKADGFLCGNTHGRIRAMQDWQGKNIISAGPSVPVQITGFDKIPAAGDDFIVMNEAQAKEMALKRLEVSQVPTQEGTKKKYTYVDIWNVLTGEGAPIAMNLIVKTDSSGACEAIVNALAKTSRDNIEVNIILKGIGSVVDSDVLLAHASQAKIIAFKTEVPAAVMKNADLWKVSIKKYDIIYDIIDDLNAQITKTLAPKEEEVSIGKAEVRMIFTKPKIGTIAGSYVLDGLIKKGVKAILWRSGAQVYTGTIASLKHLRDERNEMKSGQECGIMLADFIDYRPGDVVEALEVRAII